MTSTRSRKEILIPIFFANNFEDYNQNGIKVIRDIIFRDVEITLTFVPYVGGDLESQHYYGLYRCVFINCNFTIYPGVETQGRLTGNWMINSTIHEDFSGGRGGASWWSPSISIYNSNYFITSDKKGGLSYDTGKL